VKPSGTTVPDDLTIDNLQCIHTTTGINLMSKAKT